MTDNIPVHLRITGLTPSNDDVDSRRLAVADLAKTWGKVKDVDLIVAKAAAIAVSLGGDGNPTAELGTEVQGAVQKHASAFLYEDRPLEVGVCAGMADHFGFDVLWTRVAFVALTLLGFGLPLLVYLTVAILAP